MPQLQVQAPVDAVLPTLPHFTGPEFNQLFNAAALPNLAPLDDAPAITSSTEMDDDIRLHAEERGYVRRPVPADWSGLRFIDTKRALQAPAARAWEALVEEAATHGYDLVLNSAYRGHRY